MGQAVLTLLVALAAVGAASLYLFVEWTWSVAFLALLMVTGLALDRVGRQRVLIDPVSSVLLLEWWVLFPAALAALVLALGLLGSVLLAVPTDPTAAALFKATIAALTGFGLAIAVKRMEDADALVGKHVRKVFEESFGPRFTPGSDGQRAVYESEYNQDVIGWGSSERRARAKVLEKELKRPPDHS